MDVVASFALAAIAAVLYPSNVEAEPRVPRGNGLASKKGEDSVTTSGLLATFVQTHTDERVPLDAESPTPSRFDALLADRAVGARTILDPRLLTLLRTLAAAHRTDAGLPAIELVSGFRSPKLNEMLRKKGHHVASHSQHSLGHAVDFRIVVPEAAGATALDPRAIVREIRSDGWDGGTGIYTLPEDWFVHADVGPNRTWFEGPQGAETRGMTRLPGR